MSGSLYRVLHAALAAAPITYFCIMPKVRSYLSMVAFSHTVFAMPFALIGFALGVVHTGGWTTVMESPFGREGLGIRFLLMVACMVSARSAAMAFNRYLDRNYDALNPRTVLREIPQGVIAPRQALTFTVISALLFIGSTFFINRICFYLSPVALAVVLGYSYTKRFTSLCHLILGLGLSLAPLGAYLSVTGEFALLPLLFSVAVLCWVSGFDIIYAMQDMAFDRSQGLYSIPAGLGGRQALRISRILHLLSAAAVIAAGSEAGWGILYWAGAALFAGMLVYQQRIVRPDDLSRVNRAFMTANGIASVFFAGFVLADLFLLC
ncbi:MAG: hypothetical protein RJA57_1050 [Bacteroidota bacterium]|jgi:4-hydroxybenzoate polyprenyltransferase